MNARTVLRRIGSAAIVVALIGLGLVAGLAVGPSAHAGGSDSIQIKMPGQSDFSTLSSRPLLAVDQLTPGGSVSGSMRVRDASGTEAGSGLEDSLVLTMITDWSGERCPSGHSDCDPASAALAEALEFSLEVSDPVSGATLVRSPESVSSLRDGVLLASGLSGGDEISVRLTASLPRHVGNDVADGAVDFDLQLGLITVAAASTGGASGAGDGSVAVVGVGGSAISAGAGDASREPSAVVVIGGDSGSLSYTGLPVGALTWAAVGLLAVGSALVVAGRARRRRREPL